MNIDNEIASSGRLIAVGDIHGRANILRVLLSTIDPQPHDVFVFLGDSINRGEDSKGVIDQIIALKDISKVYCLMGNHEEMLFGAWKGGKSDLDFFLKFGGVETLNSYGVTEVGKLPWEHLSHMAACHDYLENEKYIFVHAGCNPNIPLEKNDAERLRWQHLEKSEIAPHFSGKTVVCGHSVQKKVFDLGHLICIDTGCGVWPGGRLTAIDVNSGKIWQAGARSKKATIKQREEK